MNAEQRKQFFEIRRLLDNLVMKLALANEDAFNSSAAEVNDCAAAFRTWISDADYKRGDVRIDSEDGVPYWAMHDHGISTGIVCQPSKSPTMWVHCHGTTPETARSFVAEGHNPYMVGHYCFEGDVVARCNQDNTIHPPSVLPTAWEIV